VAKRPLPSWIHAREAPDQIRGRQHVERTFEVTQDLSLQPTAVIDEGAKQRAEHQQRDATA